MRKSNCIIIICALIAGVNVFGQNKTAVIQNLNSNLPDNSAQQITAAKVRETLSDIVNYTSAMTPSMSIAQLRAGDAGNANLVIINDSGKHNFI